MSTSFTDDIGHNYRSKLYEWGSHVNTTLEHAQYQVAGRIAHALLIPSDVVTSCIDGAYGFTASALTFITLGKSNSLYMKARTHLYSFGLIISNVYFDCVKLINPHAQINDYKEVKLVRYLLTNKIKDYANNCINSKSLLKAHVMSRLCYALSLIATIIGRLIDFAIGLLASIFSITVLGTDKVFNDTAHTGLKIFGLAGDIFSHAIKIINPWAGTYLNEPVPDKSGDKRPAYYAQLVSF